METPESDGLVVFTRPKFERAGMHTALERMRQERLKETGSAEPLRLREEQAAQWRHDAVDHIDAVVEGDIPESTVVPNAKIKQNLDKALGSLQHVFASAASATVGDMRLDEIEVGLEIGTDGSVGIPGFGVKVTGKSTVTVRFKRADVSKPSNVQ